MFNWLPQEAQHLALLPIEQGINHALSYAPATLAALAPYQGQLLAIETDKLGSIFVRFIPEGISLSRNNLAEPTAAMQGSISDFMQLAQASNKADALINSAIDMSGDSDLPIRLARIMESLDIDWEALIAPATGGLVAHQLGRGLRHLSRLGQQHFANFKVASKQFAEDERQWVASQQDIKHFAEDVDHLKLATDRLQARLEQLLAAQSSKE